MKIIDLACERKKALDFVPLEIPNVDDDKLPEILDNAERALHKYKKMLECVTKADELTDGLTFGWLYDFMSEDCSVPDYEDSAMDVLSVLKKHLQAQVARFTQFCDDLQAEIEDCEEQSRNDAQYGNYKQQVEWIYSSSRI